MKKKQTRKPRDPHFRTLVFFAFRYCLGRNTYAASMGADWVKLYRKMFTREDLVQMNGEIDTELRLFEHPAPIVQGWKEFQEWLTEQIKKEDL